MTRVAKPLAPTDDERVKNIKLPNGQNLGVYSDPSGGTIVTDPDGSQRYFPPVNPNIKAFVEEKIKVQQELSDAKFKDKIKRGTWQLDVNDEILSLMDRGRYR